MEVNPLDRKIWWLASYPKSGNTWVRMFINAYSTGFPLDINSAFQFAMGDIQPEVLQLTAARPLQKITVREQFYYHPAMLMNILNLNPTKHICLKTHNAKCKVEDVPTIPASMSGGAIYLIRDPRDVCISLSNHFDITIDEAIVFMNNMKQAGELKDSKLVHILLTWSTHVLTWTEKNEDVPTTVIRYEDLLDDPEGYFKEVLKALNFTNINEERFQFALEETRFSNLQKYEDEIGFREKAGGDRFFRVGKAGQWYDVLSKDQVARIEDNHREVMLKHNYTLTTNKLTLGT